MNRPLLALCLTTAAALAVPSMASAASKGEMYTHKLQSETENIVAIEELLREDVVCKHC